ncbi:hypothetical protein AKJ16_DCAP04943 [Drosera capensis]
MTCTSTHAVPHLDGMNKDRCIQDSEYKLGYVCSLQAREGAGIGRNPC